MSCQLSVTHQQPGAQSVHSALHCQAIDEQVEREQSPCDSLDRGETSDRGVADPHAEVLLHTSLMAFTAQLIQQSANFNNFHRCVHPLSCGNSQRSFMQLLMRYWQIPFQL